MKFKRIVQFYYSPTGTTQTIIGNIADGISSDPKFAISNNLTYPEYADSLVEVTPEDLVVIAAPVYAGRIAPEAKKRFENIQFANNLAVLVAVYGNRNYDDALIDLREMALGIGLRPIAAAAFIGEHSYSTRRDPIGFGRPDAADKEKAQNFGRQILAKVESLSPDSALAELKVPGNFPLPEPKTLPEVSAETVAERCTKCGACQTVCPTGAIYYFKKAIHTHKELCTLCYACVRECKQNARVIKSDHLRKIREWLLSICKERKEPEIFI